MDKNMHRTSALLATGVAAGAIVAALGAPVCALAEDAGALAAPAPTATAAPAAGTTTEADLDLPVLIVPEDLTIQVGDDFDPMQGVSATDPLGNDITHLVTVTVRGANGSTHVDTSVEGSYTLTYTVTLPLTHRSVTITRTLTVKKSIGTDLPAVRHAVTVGHPDHGRLSANHLLASKGETVRVTATPDDGYRIKSVTVTDASGWTLDLEPGSDGSYSFQMPDSRVSVEASFVRIAPQRFVDVDYSAWYAPGVDYVSSHGIMNGYSGVSADKPVFGVGRTLTRAEFATLLYNYVAPGASNPVAINRTGMSDVRSGAYYTAAANWAVKNGVIEGYRHADGSRSFGPNDPVTLEQMVKIIARLSGADVVSGGTGALGRFVDADEVSPWAVDYVAWGARQGLVEGYTQPDGQHIRPAEPIMRERVATVIMRAVKAGVL